MTAREALDEAAASWTCGVKRVQAFRRAMAKAGLPLDFATVTRGAAGTAQSEADLDALLAL